MINTRHPHRPDGRHDHRYATGPAVSWSANGRDMRVTLATGAIIVPAVSGRGAHRRPPVSLVKAYVPASTYTVR